MSMNWWMIPSIIKGHARKKKQIIYGARAMNKQMPMFFHRSTEDFDVFAKKPKESAEFIQKQLDKQIAGGKNEFYMKSALHPGTHKVMHVGKDKRKGTKDDIGIADYTEMPKPRPAVKIINGIRYESIPSIERGRKKTLKDPESEYRHKKDKEDLERIKYTKVFRKRI